MEFSAEVFSVAPGTNTTGSLSAQNRLNQEVNVSIVLPEGEDDCSRFGLEDARRGEAGFVSSGVYRLPSASDSFTEGSRSINVQVEMPSAVNESLRCEAVTSIESAGASGVAGDLVLRAEPGAEPFAGGKSFFESWGRGEALDDLGAFLFYMMSGVRGLAVIAGIFGLVGAAVVWAVRRYQ